VLVPSENPDALSLAIANLAQDPERRLLLGRQGETRVRSAFSFSSGVERLIEKFGAAVVTAGRDAA